MSLHRGFGTDLGLSGSRSSSRTSRTTLLENECRLLGWSISREIEIRRRTYPSTTEFTEPKSRGSPWRRRRRRRAHPSFSPVKSGLNDTVGVVGLVSHRVWFGLHSWHTTSPCARARDVSIPVYTAGKPCSDPLFSIQIFSSTTTPCSKER